jgi:multiple sugar transport system substrate-binding protein
MTFKGTHIALALTALFAASPAIGADATNQITVWGDATRQPAIEAFEKAHPEIKVNLVLDDGSSGASGTFQTKIALADQAGEGWPDVVFSTQVNDAAWASKDTNGAQAFAMALNKGFLDPSFFAGFTPGALDPVTVDGTVYGLRNDLAPVLFWYNKALLTKFGYDVPKTWEDYQALGDKLAADHPGYFLGSVGDSFEGPYIYYWSGEAPVFQVKGNTFSSDVTAPNSAKVTALLDHMLKNGSVTQDSVFASSFVAKADHLVAIPGPAWYAGALFQNPASVNAKAGEWGAADPLYWSGGDKVTGNVGGGVWYASSHTTNPDAVKTFLKFVITDDKAAGTGGLPAYKAAADDWLTAQASSGFYAGDFKAAISTAAGTVWNGWGYPNFSPETSWAKIITPGLAAGKTIADLQGDWQQEMKNEAQVVGYDVN